MNWSDTAAPTLDDFEALARAEFAALPGEFRRLCTDVAFVVQDFPDEEVIEDLGLESEFDLMGLFQGPDLAGQDAGVGEPTMIFLYRRPILDAWADGEGSLGHIVRHVLIHEIGHHFGLSDEGMENIEEKNRR
jgi:predicted Zn-dependent protease with MMP-like domain